MRYLVYLIGNEIDDELREADFETDCVHTALDWIQHHGQLALLLDALRNEIIVLNPDLELLAAI